MKTDITLIKNDERTNMVPDSSKSGFTLAEVLITLGIIGVVAAMTIPTLIANTNGAKFRSQFKKSLSTLNQAALMSVAQYDFDFAGTTINCSTSAPENNVPSDLSFCGLLNGTLTGYSVMPASRLKLANGSNYSFKQVDRPGSTISVPGNSDIIYQLADGAIVGFSSAAFGCSLKNGETLNDLDSACYGFIDVNGISQPNKEVECEEEGTMINGVAEESGCSVPNNAKYMGDVFPIAFHDSTVEPLTNAARYVLTTAK